MSLLKYLKKYSIKIAQKIQKIAEYTPLHWGDFAWHRYRIKICGWFCDNLFAFANNHNVFFFFNSCGQKNRKSFYYLEGRDETYHEP